MFSELFPKLRRVVCPRKAEEATYQKLDAAEQGHQPNNNVGAKQGTHPTRSIEEIKNMREREARIQSKRELHDHNFAKSMGKLQRQLQLRKEKRAGAKIYPSLRTDEELEWSARIKTNEQKDEEELEYQIREYQLLRAYWYQYHPDLHTPYVYGRGFKQYKERVLKENKLAVLQKSQEKQRLNEKDTENDELPSYTVSENLGPTSRRQHIESLIEKKKAEIQSLERQLREETEREETKKSVQPTAYADATLQAGGVEQSNLVSSLQWIKEYFDQESYEIHQIQRSDENGQK